MKATFEDLFCLVALTSEATGSCDDAVFAATLWDICRTAFIQKLVFIPDVSFPGLRLTGAGRSRKDTCTKSTPYLQVALLRKTKVFCMISMTCMKKIMLKKGHQTKKPKWRLMVHENAIVCTILLTIIVYNNNNNNIKWSKRPFVESRSTVTKCPAGGNRATSNTWLLKLHHSKNIHHSNVEFVGIASISVFLCVNPIDVNQIKRVKVCLSSFCFPHVVLGQSLSSKAQK